MNDFREKDGFRKIFNEYYGALCNYSVRIVYDMDVAEDTVQAVFIRLWENRESLTITGSLKAYLFNSVRNASLDYLRAQKRKDKYVEQTTYLHQYEEEDTGEDMQVFRYKLYEAIKKLKPKTREIFMLHKMEGLTYKEIAEHLNLPKRTVEYNIYTALAQLKEKLKADYEKHVTV